MILIELTPKYGINRLFIELDYIRAIYEEGEVNPITTINIGDKRIQIKESIEEVVERIISANSQVEVHLMHDKKKG